MSWNWKKELFCILDYFAQHSDIWKKKVQNLLKNSKNFIFLKFQILIYDRNRPGISQYVAGRSGESSSLLKIFFMLNWQKLTNLSQKTYPPKRAFVFFFFFFFFLGGGGGREIISTMCLGLKLCGYKIFYFFFEFLLIFPRTKNTSNIAHFFKNFVSLIFSVKT